MCSTMLKIAVLCLALSNVHGKVYSEVVAADTNWVFLDKFVYDSSGKGIFKYNIQVMAFGVGEDDAAGSDVSYTCKCEGRTLQGDNVSCAAANAISFEYTDCTMEDRPGAYLLFYNDVEGGENSWEEIYDSRQRTPCDDRVKRAQQPIPLRMGQVNSGQVDIAPAARARFWYVVIANCAKEQLRATAVMEFRNEGWETDDLQSHFSYDEQGMFEMTIFFFTMYALGFFGLCCVIRDFSARNIMHEIHWLMVGSFVSYMLGHMLLLIHFVQYADDGKGHEWMIIFARCFEVVGFVVFVNVLLLIARGWTITTNKLSRKVENALFSAILACIYIALFFSETMRDPAESSYLYHSWAGYLFIAMQIFLLFVFVGLLHRTFVFEKRVVKRTFYKRFGLVFTLWFLKLPLLVLIASFVEPWYQAKVMFGCEHCFQLLSFLLVPCLSKPKTALEIYAADNNYGARIPSVARQLRVQPGLSADIVHGGAAGIRLPQAQVAGSLPGGLPPVNRNMTTDLNEANRRQQTALEEAAQAQASNAVTANGNSAEVEGEGIVERESPA